MQKDEYGLICLREFDNGSFERGAPLWKEALWVAAKSIFFLPSWPWPSALRVGLLRLFGARVGKRVVIRARVNITFPWRLELHDDVWLGEEVLLLTLAPIIVESNVCISQRAFLCTGSHSFRKRGFDLVTKPIRVRRGSWIAAQAFIAPGVDIGAGTLVAPASVVTASTAGGVVVRGNPAVVSHRTGGGDDFEVDPGPSGSTQGAPTIT